ncbi:Calcineurin-like phosphoesterase superfamily domain protein [Rosistilla oblonga]|uniref:metallophosphoesterase family protein n=1 Tax=Rosistilla oblonga TaxID=2527990 RepID=UPI00118925EC|nr:metallophosphoesterase [Rosistilla oblonga]QDV14187.1 Calcineurin-like phosphoesterase superfamily domain protein [Rosistilla oblonga]
MKRRTFFGLGTAAAGLPLINASETRAAQPVGKSTRGSFSVDGNLVRFYSADIRKPLRVLVAADTHLFLDDERGKPFHEFSGRMAGAYNTTRHFKTGEATNPQNSFTQIIERAQERNVDLLALVGDIFSFPSEAAIEWVADQLAASKLRYCYVAGNHDWHYEGMPGSIDELRATWIERRLKPLYQGNNPLMSAYDIGDVRFLAIDNSTYEILPEQLDFFRAQAETGKPLVLTVHIPMFAPGRPVGFGCGHPDWGANSDRNHKIERRPQWPTTGHTQATLDFHRDVFATPNLLGIFAGHTHRSSVDVINGIPQFVTDDNASGAFMDVELLPA